MEMKKQVLMTLFAAATSLQAFAGGYLTNTNQNAAFVRNFAQEGTITLTSIYANPAGGGFLSDGWHLSLNSQTAIQQRNIETTFPLFQRNVNNHDQTHEFKGKAVAPIVPSFTLSYNHDKWSVSAHFAVVGGGGKCEFDKGLGSFEAAYSGILEQRVPAALPLLLTKGLMEKGMDYPTASALAATGTYDGYSMNSFMKGNSYYFGLQVGGTYKFLDNLVGYLGVRGVYASCNYNGAVNPSISYSIPAAGTFPGANGTAALNNYGIELNCDQTGFGVSPIIGVDWEINKHWNVSAKYEFHTRINLKNKSEINIAEEVMTQAAPIIGQFADGEKVREDIPAMLACGVQYSPIEAVRLSAGYHQFFDTSSKKYNDKQELIDHNTHEILVGAEYDINKFVTISASWEKTFYGQSDAFMNDLSFNLTNNMVGGGVRLHPSKYFNVDLGYMCTFYKDREVTTQTAAGPKTDLYKRKNHTIGIGFNLYL